MTSSNADSDFYELLGVSPDASGDEIRQAYRRLVRTVHPDMGGSAALFRMVQRAYETLGDPEQRAAYDDSSLPVSPVPDTYDPGPDYDDYGEYVDYDGPDPGWGSEYVYDAEDADAAEERWARRRWNHRWTRGRGGLVVTVTCASITAALFTLIAYMLIFRLDWLQPNEARRDFLSILLGEPMLTGIVVAVYGGVVSFSIWMGDFFGYLLWRFDVAVLVGLALWPLFYWDIASGHEEARYLWILAAWVAYRISVLVTAVVLEKDI